MFDPQEIPVSDHELRKGDTLVFYTDGITECKTAGEDMFGLERLVEILGRDHARNPENLVRDVTYELDSFAKGREPHDDQTILVASIH